MATKRYETGGGVVIDQQKALLLDRPQRNEIRLPKGHIEENETPQMAALRETMEETGYANLQIIADLGFQHVEFDYKEDHYIRTEYYYLMQLTGHQQIKRSADDKKQFRPRWVPIEDVVNLLTFPAEQQVARLAITEHIRLQNAQK